jgi:hypothetical protein
MSGKERQYCSLQVKVAWTNLSATSTTWEDYYVLRARFPSALAWGQAGSSGGGGVRRTALGTETVYATCQLSFLAYKNAAPRTLKSTACKRGPLRIADGRAFSGRYGGQRPALRRQRGERERIFTGPTVTTS